MTSGRSGKDDNLWRDLAATVVQQVADRVRKINESQAHRHDQSPPTQPGSSGRYSSGPSSWSRTDSSSYEDNSSPYGAESLSFGDDSQRGSEFYTHGSSRASGRGSHGGPMASLGGELRKLMSEGIRMSTNQASEFKQMLDAANTDRERKRVEAPMRKAQNRSRANKAGAVTMGVVSVGLLAGTASLAVADEAPAAVPAGVATVGFGAGAFAFSRRGKRYQQIADSEARRLGAASAEAISLHGASAYSVPLPPKASMAYDPTRRLMAQKKALADLLPDIEQLAPELAPLARESESTLAEYAERIIKLERAQAAAHGASSLDGALARAVAQYEEGVDAHQKLVEAAATVMAELTNTGIGDPAHHSIDAAADRLQGLAEGLRQVRYDIPMGEPEPMAPPTQQPGPKPANPAPRPGRGQNRHRRLAD